MKIQPDVGPNSAGVLFDHKVVLGDVLCRRILSMELAPGTIVDEPALCDESGLSCLPMRELLRQIAVEGYIRLEANRVPRAVAMSHDSLHVFFFAASLIYIATTQLTATRVSEVEIETFKAIQEDFREAIKEKRVGNRIIHNDTFHPEIGRMAHNDYLVPSLRRLLIDHTRLGKVFYCRPTTDGIQRDLELACDQYDQIANTVQRRDPDAAADIVRVHFELPRRRVAEYVAPTGVEVTLVYEGQQAPRVMTLPEKRRWSCRGWLPGSNNKSQAPAMTKVTHPPADDRSCSWYHLSSPRRSRPTYYNRSTIRWMVVGVGFTDLTAARQLALHSLDEEVVLVEAQEAGFGTAGRSTDFAIGLPRDINADDYIGDIAIVRIILRLNLAGQSLLHEQIQCHAIDCQMKACGKYRAVVEARDVAVLDIYRRGLDQLNQACEVIEADGLLGHIGVTFYHKALFAPGTLLVQPSALTRGLADSLPGNISLYEHTPITTMEYGDRILLSHPHGSILADRLALANNTSGMNFGLPQGRMLPIFTYASSTWPLAAEEQAHLGGRPYWGLIPVSLYGTMVRRTPDNRLLVRGSFSSNPDGRGAGKCFEHFAVRHHASLRQRLPILPRVDFDYAWGGSLVLSRNHMRHFGELAPNVYGVLCCNGLGVTHGTVTGKLLADWLADERNELIGSLLCVFNPSSSPPKSPLSLGVNLSLRWGQY